MMSRSQVLSYTKDGGIPGASKPLPDVLRDSSTIWLLGSTNSIGRRLGADRHLDRRGRRQDGRVCCSR